MTTSSEDVLLSIAHVRYKKGDGTFYVMNQRLAWMVENRDTVAVSHRFADIKTQKISPAGKAKIQLQVVLHDGGCSTFHFANPAGASAAEEDRDRVKQLLQSLLPKFRRQVDRELEEKSRLLSLHPVLKHLYEDLVITKVINSEEYWNTPTLKQYTESQTVKQDVGVSGAFLADIQPQTDGCNGLKYNLTQDIIDAIFKTYPAVRKKHQDHVPNKMTEAEFWTKFFQSHYFHRDRISSASSKDLFGECARLDDVAIAHAMKSSEPDMTVDLPRFTEQTPLLPPEEESKGDGGSIHRNMIKRFNQHSIMVLKASQKPTNSSAKSKHTPEENGVTLNGKVSDGKNKTKATPSSTEVSPAKKRRILDQIHYEDLEGENSNDVVEPELVLSKIERYLLGPSSSNTLSAKSPELPPVSVLTSVCQAWSSGLSGSRPTRVAPAAAVGALGELSPGGLLMRHHISTSMAQLIPPEVWSELRRLYLSCGEVLRQLWRCFPSPGAPEPDSALQADQLYEALVRFRHARLQPFEDRMHRELSTIAPTLTRHLNEMIDIAVNKYVTWQQRQAKLR